MDGGGENADDERARLIDSIYEAVLRPEHYDAFMEDWAGHLERVVSRLEGLRVTAGPAATMFSDPVLESHFRRAFAILERMGRNTEERQQHLSNLRSEPLIAITGAGGIVAVSPEGIEMFGPTPTPDKVTRLLDPDSARRLQAMMVRLRRAPAAGAFAVMTCLADSDNEEKLLAACTRRDAEGQVVLELRPLEIRWTEAVANALLETFHLTPRELELVRGLITQGDLASIATRTGRSLNTLRAQLKSVFQKTRTGSQPDLLRMVAAIILFSPEPGRPSGAEGARDRFDVVVVEGQDGRQVPAHVMGPTDGRPIVFIHGMLDGLAITNWLHEGLRQRGLRLIAPVRANFGAASPNLHIRDAPERFAADLEILLDRLRIGRTLLVGHMAGAVYAFAAAARLRSAAVGIVNVSGGVPIRSISQFRAMTPRQRTVAVTARFAPALLPAILRAGIAQIDGKDAIQFVNALYPPESRDRAVVSNPEFARAIIDGYRFSVAQGEQAFRIDSWHVTRDWSELVQQSHCPVLLLHGKQDPVVQVDTVRAFAEVSNRTELRVFDEGQLLFYSATDSVLDAISEFLLRVDSAS